MERKKLVKRDYFEMLLAINEVTKNKSLVDFINHELELLEKKSTSNKMSKTQQENQEIKKFILEDFKQIGKAVTISELQELSKDLQDYSNQKLTSLITQLYNKGNGVLTREEVKGKAYYSIKED
jgi:tRNA uridine 5-carbamoylmethylation protein Kti12